jgi:hypothetical protein
MEQGFVSLSHSLLSVLALVKLGVRFAGSLVIFMAAEMAEIIGSTVAFGTLTQINFLLTS